MQEFFESKGEKFDIFDFLSVNIVLKFLLSVPNHKLYFFSFSFLEKKVIKIWGPVKKGDSTTFRMQNLLWIQKVTISC